MNQAPLESILSGLVERHPGVRGCALVEAASGLVWHRHPAVDLHGIWEAAVEHWRLQQRLSRHFDELGPTHAVSIFHREVKFVLLPCLRDPDVLLVCLASHDNVDWSSWQREGRELAASLRTALQHGSP